MTTLVEDEVPIPTSVPEYDGASPNAGSLKAVVQNLQRQITAISPGGTSSILPDPTGKTGWVLSNDGAVPLWVQLETKNMKTDFGAIGDGVTDDTLAFQAAINYGENNNGLACFIPSGRYLIAGVLQDTGAGGGNAQLIFPHIGYNEKNIPMYFFSDWPVPQQPVVGATPVAVEPTFGAIIITNNTQSTGTQPSMFGVEGGQTVNYFTNIDLKLQNLRFVSYADPDIIPLNLANMGAVDLDGVCVDTGVWHTPSVIEPTHVDAYGVITPANNNGARTRIRYLIVIGYYVGLRINEHSVIDECSVWACKVGFEVGVMYHGWTAQRLLSVHCQQTMRWSTFGGGSLVYARGVVNQIDIEQAPGDDLSGWQQDGIIDFYDPTNVAYGIIHCVSIVLGNYGNLSVAIFAGCSNLILNVF